MGPSLNRDKALALVEKQPLYLRYQLHVHDGKFDPTQLLNCVSPSAKVDLACHKINGQTSLLENPTWRINALRS